MILVPMQHRLCCLMRNLDEMTIGKFPMRIINNSLYKIIIIVFLVFRFKTTLARCSLAIDIPFGLTAGHQWVHIKPIFINSCAISCWAVVKERLPEKIPNQQTWNISRIKLKMIFF